MTKSELQKAINDMLVATADTVSVLSANTASYGNDSTAVDTLTAVKTEVDA